MKRKIILLLLFISHSFGSSYNDYMANLKLENYSEEEKNDMKPVLERLYTVQEKNFQEIQKNFYQKTKVSEWKFDRTLGGQGLLDAENSDKFTQKLDGTFPVVEGKKTLEIFPNIHLTQAPSGQLFLNNDGKFQELSILNFWTKSPSGCLCKFGSETNCACCHREGCVCSSETETCVQCGFEYDASKCSKENLELGSVFGFSESTVPEVIVIMIQEKSLLFFKYSLESKYLMEVNHSEMPMTIDIPNQIEDVFYEEILTFGLDGLEKRRFLFIISKLGASNSCYEIIIDSDQETFSLRKILDFSLKGKYIKVFNMHGEIFIGYVNKDQVLQLEQFKIYDDKAVLNRFLNLNYKIETWHYMEGTRNNFLLLKEGNHERILLFDEDMQSFIPHQDISAVGVQKILPVKVPKGKRNELLIFISNGSLGFYTLDRNNKFENVHTEKFSDQYVLSETTVFSFADSLYLLIPSSLGSDLFKIFLPESVENVDLVSESLMKKFGKLKDLFDYQINSLESLEQELEDLLSHKKKTLAKEISRHTFDSIQHSLDSLEHNIQIVKKSLDESQVFLEDVVPKHGTKKVISGMKHFYGPETEIKELVVEYVKAGNVSNDEETLFKIVQNLVQINDERTIYGRKIFLGKSEVKDLHTSILNGKYMKNLMTVNKPMEIGKVTYTNGIKVKNDIKLLPDSTVYGIDLSEDLVGFEGQQKLGSCSFKDLRTLDGIEIQSDLVNSENFKGFIGSLLTSNRDLTFEGSVALSQMTVNGNLNSNYLMKVDTNYLFSQIILKDENETLSVVTFDAPVICNQLEANRINNEKFPEEFVIKSDSWIDFGSEKYFDKINFKKLSVEGYVDTLRTENLVTKSTSQDVLGSKIFEKGVNILGDLNILASRIDGVDLHLFMKIPETTEEASLIIFEEEVETPGLIVNGKVNGLALQDVAADLLYKDELESVITGRKIFLKDLIVENGLTSKSVNDIDFDNFANTEERTIFKVQKSFSKTVNFDNLKVNGLVDNVNLTKLFGNSVFLDKPYQFITGKKVFRSIFTNVLKIEDTINGSPLVNFLTKTTDQEFTNDLILDKVSFDKLMTEKVFLYKTGTLNGISMKDIKKQLELEGNIDESLIVIGDVYVAQELQVEKLNGRKTKDLYDLLLRNEELQLLSGNLNFAELVIYGSVWTTDLTAGNATMLKRKAASALRTLEKNFVSSEDLIWDFIEAQELDVMGLVNGFKLYNLEKDSIFANDPGTFSVKGPKHFLNSFKVNGDLESNYINGLNLKNLFSRTQSQVIYDNAHFEHLNLQNASITSFNGIDISLFTCAQKREKIIIKGPLTLKGFVHVSSLKLDKGYLGGIDVKGVLDDAVDLRAGKIIIPGKKTFVQPPTFTNLNVVKLNNKELPKLIKNINDIAFDYIVVNGSVNVSKVKAKNLVTKNQESLLHPSHIRSEFLLIDEVLNPMILENLIVYGNISANRVNGYVLGDEFLTKTTDQSIGSVLSISSMLTKDVFVEGLVNGYRIPSDSIVQESTKVINGSVIHNGSIHIPANLFVKGLFGGRNIKIPDDLIILTEDAKFNGLLSFHAPLVTTFIKSKSTDEEITLNGMTLSTLDKLLTSFRELLAQKNLPESVNHKNSFLETLKNTWSSECLKTKRLQDSLSQAFIEPHSFVLSSVQEFEVSNATKFFDYPMESDDKSAPVLIFKAASEHWMINSLHFGYCETKLLKWSRSKRKFIVQESIGNDVGKVRSWIKLESPEFEKVFLLAVGYSEGKCKNKGSTLWSFDLNTLKMERVQKLKSAINAVALDGSYIFWDFGLHNSLMSFSNGRLELINSKEKIPKIKLFKVFTKPGGVRLIISYFDDILDIVDDNDRRSIFLPNVVGFEIIRTSNEEIILLVSKLKFGLTGEVNTLEAYLYENMNIFSISIQPLESFNLIRNLEIPKNDYDHSMIFALSANHPRILTLGGFPFIKTWREFPSKLNNRLWAYDFIDSDNNFYLCFGDQSQIYTVRLERQGMKYHSQYVNCT